YIVVVKDACVKKEVFGSIERLLSSLQTSSNIFIFTEAGATKPLLDAFKKAEGQVQECGTAREGKLVKEDFNPFSLADAFGARDRKKLWALYQQVLRRGSSPEEVAGTLFWQIKSIMLAQEAKTPAKAGLSPFVFEKAKRYGARFSAEDGRQYASRLLYLYHDAHRGLVDFEVGLERFVLTL
ncbi:MAG: hypothetical protein NUV54_03150, partial [Candidatus Taylorbacteria bacterium]|nr:hypothetical protein [Candidatus Taylorbacteria bacterium]